MKPEPLLRILLICAGMMLQVEVVFACTCGMRPTVLDAYENYDVVMIARVRSINPDDYPAKVRHLLGGVRAATVVVEKVYKGNVRIGDEILFQQGSGSDCGMTFPEESIGKRILFYVPEPQVEPRLLSVSFCERSRQVEIAKEDLVYLDNIEKLRGKTRISGMYGAYTADFDRSHKKIRIVGDTQTYETTTDEDGFYELYDLPPGKYRLEPEIPEGWRISEYAFHFSSHISRQESSTTSLAFTLPPQRHVSIDLALRRKRGPQ